MEYAGNFFNKFQSKNVIIKKLMESYTKTVISMLDSIRFRTMLEIGCGEGYLVQNIKQRTDVPSLILSDISHEILLTARNLHPSIPLLAASAFNLPFRDAQFDLICVAEVLEHLAHPEPALDEFARVCNQYVLFSVPREPIWRLLNIIRLSYLDSWGNTPGHVQHWTSREFKHLLRSRFEILSFRTPFPWSMALCRVKER